jgi:hypothetical protein
VIEQPSVESAERRWYFTNFRQAFGKAGSAYGLATDDKNPGRWKLACILPGGSLLNVANDLEYEEGLRLQDYCAQRDTATKMALMEVYENGNFKPILDWVEKGKALGALPRRRMKVTLELEVESRGSDEEIKSYLIMHARSSTSVMAAVVTNMAGPRLTEPRRISGETE